MAGWGVLGTVKPHWGGVGDLDSEGLCLYLKNVSNYNLMIRCRRKNNEGKRAAYIWASTSGRNVTRESKISGAVDRARFAKRTLGNGVVASVELELEGVSDGRLGVVGAEGQTFFSDLDDMVCSIGSGGKSRSNDGELGEKHDDDCWYWLNKN